MKKIVLIVITLVTVQSISAQWAKGKGKGFYKLSAWYLNTDQHYTDTGEIDPNATRTQFNLNLYAEYGLTNRLDIVTYLPFFARVTQNNQVSGTVGTILQEGEAVNSIGDIDLGLSYNFYKTDGVTLASRIMLGLPTGENSGGSDGSYQTGDGEFNQYLSVLGGFSLKLFELPAYAKTYLGYNNRTEGFSDELRYGIELGANLIRDKLWTLVRFDNVSSMKNGTLDATTAQGSIFANNVEYLGISVEASYYLSKKLGVSFNYGGAVSGRIIAANPSFSAGIFLDIK